MKNLTKTQIATVVLIVAYLVWEYVILADWKAETEGPLIRVDLVVIYPVLAILAVISLIQFIRGRGRN